MLAPLVGINNSAGMLAFDPASVHIDHTCLLQHRFVRAHEASAAATASPSARVALANGMRKAAASDKPAGGSLPPLLGSSGGLAADK